MSTAKTHHIEILRVKKIDFLSHFPSRKIGEVPKTSPTGQLRNGGGVQKPVASKLIAIDNSRACYTIGWIGNIGKI